MKRVFSLLVFALLFTISICGQSVSDFEKKYGARIYYEVRPKVLMSAEFNKIGQICQASFQPNPIPKKEKNVYLGLNSLDTEVLREIFDELVPPETRLGKFESMGIIMTGSMGFSAISWENVRFNAQYNLGQKYGEARRNKRPFDLSQNKKEKINQLFSLGEPNLAFITWTNRNCIG